MPTSDYSVFRYLGVGVATPVLTMLRTFRTYWRLSSSGSSWILILVPQVVVVGYLDAW
jgi:hypothetical protein